MARQTKKKAETVKTTIVNIKYTLHFLLIFSYVRDTNNNYYKKEISASIWAIILMCNLYMYIIIVLHLDYYIL